eukprot:TRINITY_DN43664_c0_g1_i2.p1 TRINITY_DN43664_c0_g1~~TRINITY_DN43664_c0_g1_i2.p1  ORF type:complete len:908 (+),score=213.48 TRINITY_DN43664_c0_g1_i2:183-2906(+)
MGAMEKAVLASAKLNSPKSDSQWLEMTLSSLECLPKSEMPKTAENEGQESFGFLMGNHSQKVPLEKWSKSLPFPSEVKPTVGPLSDDVSAWLATTLASAPRRGDVSHYGSRSSSRWVEADCQKPLHSAVDGAASSEGSADLAGFASNVESPQSPPPPPLADATSPVRPRPTSASSTGPPTASGKAPKLSEREHMAKLATILPDAQALLQRLRSGCSGFSPKELARIERTFVRFRVPETHHVHKDDLPRIIQHLGYSEFPKEVLKKVADGVTEFSTLEFPEFRTFLENYLSEEELQCAEMFKKFDADSNGQLDVNELTSLLTYLGFKPLRKMVLQAIDMVDLDHDGQLNVEEFSLLMAVYRNSEGFTREELDDLLGKFHEEHVDGLVEGEDCLPAQRLAHLLTRFFGPGCAEAARKLAQEVATSNVKADHEGDADGGRKPPLGLQFSELLIMARRLRDQEVEAYRSDFERFDVDGNGRIDMEEFRGLISTLGFTLSQSAINEVIREAKRVDELTTEATTLDFDDFVNVMEIFRVNDGFSKAELAEMLVTFNRFDEDQSSDIDVIELSDMLHFMGRPASLYDLHVLMAKVDFDGNGSLSFREFVRLMRLYRQEELQSALDVFKQHQDEAQMMPGESIPTALEALIVGGKTQSQLDLQSTLSEMGSPTSMDFDGFVDIVDQVRMQRVEQLRKFAGFSGEEIERLKSIFDTYDATATGVLDPPSVNRLLADLGCQMRTVAEQQAILSQLEDARILAVERGCTDPGPGGVNFWVLVQMLRARSRLDDKRTVMKLARAAEQAHFSPSEVHQFREVFGAWWEKDRAAEEESQQDIHQAVIADNSKVLTAASLRRLLRSLGMKLDVTDRTKLDKKVTEISPNDRVDLADFIQIMRWMVDMNFGNIRKVAPRASDH